MALPSVSGVRCALNAAENSNIVAWQIIAPFFRPPAEFAGQLGSFRSPLIFNDGSVVKNTREWPRRREEILHEWNELMGPWPKIIEQPKLEILSETNRENFILSGVYASKLHPAIKRAKAGCSYRAAKAHHLPRWWFITSRRRALD